MLRYRGRVNWVEEFRRVFEERIRELEAEENLVKIVRELEEMPHQVPKGYARAVVREDRDRN